MVWCERVTLIAALFFWGFLFIFSVSVAGLAEATPWLATHLLLPFWLFLRLLDLITGGPMRRGAKRSPYQYYPPSH